VGRNALKFAFAILFLFFVYRDGEAFLAQLRRVVAGALGGQLERTLQVAGDMSRAITQSLVLVALVQGLFAGIGYFVVGVGAPVLLGFITALASLIPMFGTFVVWGTVSAWLAATGHWWQGLALLAWGTLLINPVDNVLRPWLLSSAMRMPFLVALIGVLGGLSSFGFVGLFVGPVILAVALVLWNAGERPPA
jgi:predicted PurR-regulated permease PerM